MLLVLIISLSLSMDAFSLSLAYGMFNMKKKEIITLSIIVGIYHFIMPLLGNTIGNAIFKLIYIDQKIIVLIVFIMIGIEMIFDAFKSEKKSKITSFFEMLCFGFAVSVDSFSTGIGLKAINSNYFLCYISFSITSLICTYLGLILGKKLSEKIGNIASIIGGLMLIIIGISYIFK